MACSTQIGISQHALSAQCANKTLVPPIARQACRLDHKPKTATTATPNDQVCASRRHFVICYLSFHAFRPKRIGSSLFCIMVATWLREPRFLSIECWCNGLGRFEINWGNLLDFQNLIWRRAPDTGVERSFHGNVGPALRSDLRTLRSRFENSSAGDSPAPVGAPPSGTAESSLGKSPSPSARTFGPIPSGESPDGTGGSPVLPNTIFQTRSYGREMFSTGFMVARWL